mmetsp:Transcript_23361/g.23555  ORF Transcript_23361/g.23555 Transcript_23361/m.23555 type:complete len:316 (+) Transcript_23361:38-985(+)
MSKSVLWPRHDIFDLIIPALSQCGRQLTHNLVIDVIKQLSRVQTPDHFISFDRWVVVAKDFLKWNDPCIRLFWEMLHIATWSQSQENWKRHADSLLVEHVAIFLVLHIQEAVGRSNSPSAAYESVWPSNEHELTSPPSPTSPIRNNRKLPSSGSPKSPRSMSSSVPSPKRSTLLTSHSRQQRSTTQILYSIRQKIPLLLRAVSIDDCGLNVENLHLADSPSISSSISASADSSSVSPSLIHTSGEFPVTSRGFNALSLVLGGGYEREREITPLSSLYSSSTLSYQSKPTHHLSSSSPSTIHSSLSSSLSPSLSLK